jgi:glyoxylase-like metal-dependent hydrolase (beta-lactamase superfamily II)
MALTVTPLKLAELEGLPTSVGLYGHGAGTEQTVPVFAHLVRGGAAGPVLFDLGPPGEDVPTVPGRPTVTVRVGIGDALRQAGVDPLDVTTVVVSHLHWDHCAGLEQVPNARLLVQRAELRFAFAPDVEQWRPYDTWEQGRTAAWSTSLDRTDAIDGVVRLDDGLVIVPTPGHTPGSQSLLVERPDRSFLLCGDLVTTYDNLVGVAPRPGARATRVPPGIHHDLVAWRRSIDRVLQNGWLPVPAHDPRVPEVLDGTWDPRRA